LKSEKKTKIEKFLCSEPGIEKLRMCISMQEQSISYKELFTSFKKGLRNGNWRKLRFLDKALFRAAMWYAKRGRSIVTGDERRADTD
jgi:hypothetical protein